MAHFAKLSEDTTVLQVEVIADAAAPTEEAGIAFCQNLFGWSLWKQTSYNTREGIYYNSDGTEGDQSKAFRLNYAGIGYSYNSSLNGFVTPRPEGMSSWIINSTTGVYEPPVAYPTITTYEYNGQTKNYQISWDETNVRWVAYDKKDPVNNYRWDSSALEWIII